MFNLNILVFVANIYKFRRFLAARLKAEFLSAAQFSNQMVADLKQERAKLKDKTN